MKLFSWNVNGYRSILAKGLEEFLSTQAPDIVCLQETKIDTQAFSALPPLEGYTSYLSSAEKKGYSGVMTIVKNSIKDRIKSHSTTLGNLEFDREGRFSLTEFEDLTLYNIYFPSGTSGDHRQSFKYEFLDYFLSHLQSLPEKKRKNLIICGDFNICHKEIDIHHPKEATKRQLTGFLPEERAWMDKFTENGFTDCYRHLHGEKPHQYTWWTFRAGARGKNLGWRIDYFFVSNELSKQIKQAEILSEVTGSDHCPIFLEIK